MNNASASNSFQLGIKVGTSYKISGCASKVLDAIYNRLSTEDKTRRPFRRVMAASKMTQKDLLPMLLAISAPESRDEHKHLFEKVMKVLVNITTPIECLMDSCELRSSHEGVQTIREIETHLYDVKNQFLDPKISKAILEQAENLLNMESTETPMRDLRVLNDCVTLARNILHISDEMPGQSEEASRSTEIDDSEKAQESDTRASKKVKRQNQILWNMFAHNLDTVVIKLITSPNLPHWSTSLMQLIALVYKDQHVNKLERLLNDWLETSLSESSEDNESNTSPQYQNGSCSSPALTSAEPTDDSSDGTGNGKHSSLNAKMLSSDSGNEPDKDSKVEIIKDSEMRSDSSDSSSKEPPCKKVAMSNGNSKTSKKSEPSSHGRRSNSQNQETGANKSKNEDKNMSKKSPDCLLLRKSHSEQDSGFSSPQSHRVNNTSEKGTDSASSICGSCYCTTPENQPGNDAVSSPPDGATFNKSNAAAMKVANGDYDFVSKQNSGENSQLQECNSTSSNEEDIIDQKRNKTPHTSLQKPRPKKKVLTPTQRRELKRKKLIQRAKSNRMKVKALVHHVPTDDDIADLLKEFTVDFLLKGYSCLVISLHRQLLSDSPPTMDKSHFLWLITYFLKFASQLEVELEQIGPLLSLDTLTYLIFEGVQFCEEFELALREHNVDLNPHLRRLHLLVTALNEFIETLKTYSQSPHFTQEVRDPIQQVVNAACHFTELRQLFLLLIRRYNPAVQTRQYLKDLISSNNNLLVMIETSDLNPDAIQAHLSQFASVEVMRQYGLALENFPQNSDELNDSIFTMMHHVAGDLNSAESLFVPQILQRFSDIWEQDDVEICDDWADLIEYVIQKFVTKMGANPFACASNLLESSGPESTALDENGFTKSQLENLYWYYTQFEGANDPVDAIIEIYKRTCSVAKTRLSVIQALLSQGIITLAQYMSLMYMKSVLSSCKAEGEGSVIAEVGSEHCDSDGHDTDIEIKDELKGQNIDQLEVLKGLLRNQGKTCLLSWLQQVLLDACYAKVNGGRIQTPEGQMLEPVPHYHNYLKQSIPMIPWNKQQELGLQSEAFILLLHKLGFHLPADVGKCYPRIPHFWSVDHIYQLAQKLGPIKREELKIDLSMFDMGLPVAIRDESVSSFRSDSHVSLCCLPRSASAPPESLWNDGIESQFNHVQSIEEITFALPMPTHSWNQQRGLTQIQTKDSTTCFTPFSRSSSSDSLSESCDSNSYSLEKMQISDSEVKTES